MQESILINHNWKKLLILSQNIMIPKHKSNDLTHYYKVFIVNDILKKFIGKKELKNKYHISIILIKITDTIINVHLYHIELLIYDRFFEFLPALIWHFELIINQLMLI